MIKSRGQIAYEKHQASKEKKTIGQLIKEKHWSVEGLMASVHYSKEELKKWVK
tara:strand:- start:280 stop:438 length:159 start_codon:yes stop_codon:yes gene_type:complete